MRFDQVVTHVNDVTEDVLCKNGRAGAHKCNFSHNIVSFWAYNFVFIRMTYYQNVLQEKFENLILILCCGQMLSITIAAVATVIPTTFENVHFSPRKISEISTDKLTLLGQSYR